MLTLTVDTFIWGSALSLLSVNMVLFTITGAISPVIANVYTNGSVYTISLETSAFEELGSEFINFASNCVINTLRLIVYLTGLSI